MSTVYRSPVGDIRFALDVVGAAGFGDVDTMVDVIGEFGRYCADVIAPLNQPGDASGVQFDAATGTVTTAPGWRDAYQKYVAAGWNSVSLPSAFGGGDFPLFVTTAMQEALNAASIAFALCPMLTQGSVHLLEGFGTVEQRERFLPYLVSGEWTGTMMLTESGAGSDVGALMTRADQVGDGTYRIRGQKIFITYGEHDLTEQIVHVVLARLPDAPRGTAGISCFAVPKCLLDGQRNAVRCIGVEHKMGLHASPTCTMQFDGAFGELIGAPNEGMRAMFAMMNSARLSVGAEGLGAGVRAYQAAASFARERVQGGCAIVDHPDVRRMLLHMRSHVEAMRLLAYRTAVAIDEGDDAIAGLLTPMAKAWCTDRGLDVARLATQVHGGMGYIRETGVEQLERDVRIASIYEGTNGIQAIDLVGRKLNGDHGAAISRLIDMAGATAHELGGVAGNNLARAAHALEDTSTWLQAAWISNRRDALAGATPFLELASTTVAGWLLARQALLVRRRDPSDPNQAARVTSTNYFLERVLPHALGLVDAVRAGAGGLDALPNDLL